MALTKIKLDSMVTGTLPDANIPDDITITGLSGTNSGDNAVNTNYSGLAVTSTSVTDGTNTFNKATDFVSATSGGTFGGVVNIQKSSSAGAGVVDDFIKIKRTDNTNVLNRYTGILFTDSNTQGSAIRNIRTNYEQHYQNDLAFSTNVAGSANSLSEVMRLTGDGNVKIFESSVDGLARLDMVSIISLADGGTVTVTIGNGGLIMVSETNSGKSGLFYCDYSNNVVVEVADPSSYFETTDSGANWAIFKGSSTASVTVKNRTSATKSISVQVINSSQS